MHRCLYVLCCAQLICRSEIWPILEPKSAPSGTETLWNIIKDIHSGCSSCRNKLSHKTVGGKKMEFE
jgi:hypothetical protein